MIITAVSNPIYVTADNTQINCEITCEFGTLPFTATSFDKVPYGAQLYKDLVDEKYGVIAPYVTP